MDEMAATRSYLEAKRKRIQAEMARLSEGLKSVNWILKDMADPASHLPPVSPLDELTSDDLSGLSLVESLEIMAEKNNGDISNKDARMKLIALGLLDEESSTAKIWEALKRSTKLVKATRGQYRVIQTVQNA